MAIDQKFQELINADIDGEISAAESDELRAFLEKSAEGRELHRELTAMCSMLASVEDETPPPHLQHVIMNSVKPAGVTRETPGFLQSLFGIPALRYAMTFAAGVFLALSLVNSGQVSNRAFDDVTGLVGTVAEPVSADLESTVAIDETAVAGTVSLRSSGSILILDFDLMAMEPVEIEADYTDNTIWFNGFAQLESSGTTVSAETGRVRLGMEGKRRYAVYLQNEGSRETTVRLRFMANGALVYETSLEYAPAE